MMTECYKKKVDGFSADVFKMTAFMAGLDIKQC